MISLPRLRFELVRKRALLLTADALMVFHWRVDSVTESFIFDANESGLASFNRYLSQSELQTTYMLVDLVEEEFRQETIPHLYGADRQALITRKLGWLFRGTPYSHVLSQGRDAGGRRDEKVLFSAILNTEAMAFWLKALAKNKVPLAGIYSLPLLSTRLLADLKIKTTNTLVVTMQSASGLRQTFFSEGALKLSRLAKMPRLDSVPYAPYVIGEVEKYQRYLTSLRFASKQPMEVIILTQGEYLHELADLCRDNENLRFLLLDVSKVARSLNVQGTLTTPFSEVLFAQLLLKHLPRNHYATRSERAYAILHSSRRLLWGASAAVLIAGTGLSAWELVSGLRLQQSAEDRANKAQFYEERYQEAKRNLVPAPLDPAEIKATVETVDLLVRKSSDPMPLLITASQALKDYPLIRIDNIEWSASSGQSEQVPSTFTDAQLEHAEIKGHIDRFNGDYRLAIATVNGFVDALRRLPNIHEVSVLSLPLDVSSKSNLHGGTLEQQDTETATFTVKIVTGVRHEMG